MTFLKTFTFTQRIFEIIKGLDIYFYDDCSSSKFI